MKTIARRLIFPILLMAATAAIGQSGEFGIFSNHADVGNAAKSGSVNFNPANGEYHISGGGANMWLTNDAFHLVWKEMSGDFRLTANLNLIGTNGNAHRKACLLVRQTLAPDSAYADVTMHGSGLTSLQYRENSGDDTHEIQSEISAPIRVRLEKRGNYVSMWLAQESDELKSAGGYLPVPLTGNFLVGLGVCAHDNSTVETAVFSNVTLESLATSADAKTNLECSLETVAIASTDRRIVYRTQDRIEAPNWSRDGKYFVFNRQGRICKLPVTGGTPQVLDTGSAIKCNNDHGISPDGTMLAVSDGSFDGQSRISVVPIEGGAARQITPLAPSYWHGWRRMEKLWRIAPSEKVILTFTPFPPAAAKKRG